MNSFRFLERGIDAEIARQERDAAPRAARWSRRRSTSTRRAARITSLRSKEEAHDYRYFPEPDLVPIAPTEEMLERARDALPELPAARAERLERELGLPRRDGAAARRSARELGDFFEAALAADGGTRASSPTGRPRADRAARRRDPADTARARPAGAAGGAGGRQGGLRRRRPRRSWRAGRARAASRRRSWSRRALAARARTSSGAIVDRAIAEQPGRRREDPRRQGAGGRRDRRRRHARDEGPRRRRRGAAHDPREARRLTRAPERLSR